ncbi:MAG: MATE family efflux transporter [Euryarchaeota archaeon]|nr:MATE family efflux transporter [Euryarchaeota archaeon]
MSDEVTEGVKDLLGEPKKAILKISVPMMIGMFVQSLYNIADGFWVAGLGADQLAAVGLFFPFFMIIMALGAGIGVGGSSAISRRIGERNKEDADNTAVHTIILGIIIALVFSLPVLPFIDNIFNSISGDGNVGDMAADYARILFAGAVALIFSNIANAILRGEGDAKRAMYGLMLGSGLNIILDPIYIYGLDLGVVGAALATLTSMIVSSCLFIYWLFIKSDTYVDITFKDFTPNKGILKEILSVGVPSSLAQLSMSIAMVFLNKIVILAGGTDGVAVFTSGWRIVMLGVVPLIGMAVGVTAVTAAAFGAKDKEKLRTAYLYALKIGVLIELGLAVLIAIFAHQVAYIFTYSEGAARISSELVKFLRITAIFYPTVPLGMLTSAMFRGVAEGTRSLIVTILRTVIFQLPVVYLLGITFGFGLSGIWWGIVLGNALAVSITFLWGRVTIDEVFQDG